MCSNWEVHSHGGTSNSWMVFVRENPSMDDHKWYPYDLGNLHINWSMSIPSGNLLHSYWKRLFIVYLYPLKWWCSIVMLVYQRVVMPRLEIEPLSYCYIAWYVHVIRHYHSWNIAQYPHHTITCDFFYDYFYSHILTVSNYLVCWRLNSFLDFF